MIYIVVYNYYQQRNILDFNEVENVVLTVFFFENVFVVESIVFDSIDSDLINFKSIVFDSIDFDSTNSESIVFDLIEIISLTKKIDEIVDKVSLIIIKILFQYSF